MQQNFSEILYFMDNFSILEILACYTAFIVRTALRLIYRYLASVILSAILRVVTLHGSHM